MYNQDSEEQDNYFDYSVYTLSDKKIDFYSYCEEYEGLKNIDNEENLSINDLEPYIRTFVQRSTENEKKETDACTLNGTEENKKKIKSLFEVNNMETYTYENIINIFIKNKIPKDIIKIIEETDLNKKEQQIQIDLGPNTEKKEKKLLGRKTKDSNIEGKHNKSNEDNIIKKCKAIFIKYLIIFLNNFIPEGQKKLLHLDYGKNVDNLNIDNNKELLNHTLKEIASFDISRRHQSKNDGSLNLEYNKEIIENLLKDEKDNENINNIYNMTFKEFIDVFTLKKEKNFNFEFKGLQEALENIIKKEKENDNYDEEKFNRYFKKFVYHLYNYKIWFLKKKGRIRKKTEKNDN